VALKTGERTAPTSFGTITSATMTVGRKTKRGDGTSYLLTRTIVDHIEVFAFSQVCENCRKDTPEPDEATLQNRFDSGTCWVWPFNHWTPPGWIELNDGVHTWYLCPECR
jgi:hypothetical protein